MHGLETIQELNARRQEMEAKRATQATCEHEWQGKQSFICLKCYLTVTMDEREALEAQAYAKRDGCTR